MTGDMVIWTRGLGKDYGDVRALAGVDLAVPRNTICGFLGPNGAGKTTAMKILLGLTRPTRGEARVLGLDVQRSSLDVRRLTGYLAQSPTFYDHMTAREMLRFVAGFYLEGPARSLDRRVSEMLDLVGLSDRADRPIRGFSGGERQRLGIAQAQISSPPLLILDEPAAALDPMGRERVLEIMKQLRHSTTIFYSTHILDDVERVSDTVVILREGRIVSQGPIESLLDGGTVYTVVTRHHGPDRADRMRALLEGQPWITRIEHESRGAATTWEIRSSDAGLADRHLLRTILSDPDVAVEDFGRRRYQLEEAFMKLMRGIADD